MGSLHAKAAEIRNSVAHLTASNDQLREHADAGDEDCAQAVKENEDVIQRMESRVQMLKDEVEERGLPWHPESGTSNVGSNQPVDGTINGHAEPENRVQAGSSSAPPATSGRLSDRELQELLAERLGETSNADFNDEGVHL